MPKRNFTAELLILFLLATGANSVSRLLSAGDGKTLVFLAVILGFAVGMVCIVRTAKIIGTVAEHLKWRTGLAGGLLQAVGTALPDMTIGVLAAILSLKELSNDHVKAVQLGIIAGSTTLGSNIYNVCFASWCIWRQNEANRNKRAVRMFPWMAIGGELTPRLQRRLTPTSEEIDASLLIVTILSFITAMCALGLIFAGGVEHLPDRIDGTIYRFNKWLAGIVLLFSLYLLYVFRENRQHLMRDDPQERSLEKFSTVKMWLWMFGAAITLVLAADTVIGSLTAFSGHTNIPVAVAGTITALVGCLGEMTVVHELSVNPDGSIVDAVTGVAMDNIVTIIGASIIAIIGGIYLGGEAIVVIFVLILFANTLLNYQISQLKNF